MPRIFISYKRADKEKVFAIKDKIEAATGEKCWIDLDGIESDAQFANVIIKAIDEADIFLFMYSRQHSKIKDYEKDWTVREINYAQTEGKRIVFVNIDKTPLTKWFKFMFSSKQQVDITSETASNRLLQDINKWLGNTILSSQVNESIPTAHKSRNLLKFFKLIDKSKLPLWLKRILKMLSGLGVVLVVIIFTLGAILLFEIFKGIKNNANDDYKYEEITDTVCQPIDLGLPSKTLWGDRNIGAKNAIDFGDLYAWGETNIKEDYSRSNYVEQVKPFIQITTVKYDAAMAVLGAEWSIPTEEQFAELLNECQWIWITKDGHKGYQINGKNGNSIFLPAAGWIRESEIEYRNTYGYYWTSERSTSSQFARCLQFPKDGIGIIGNGYLNVGRSIRAVYVNDVVSE